MLAEGNYQRLGSVMERKGGMRGQWKLGNGALFSACRGNRVYQAQLTTPQGKSRAGERWETSYRLKLIEGFRLRKTSGTKEHLGGREVGGKRRKEVVKKCIASVKSVSSSAGDFNLVECGRNWGDKKVATKAKKDRESLGRMGGCGAQRKKKSEGKRAYQF